MKPCGVLSKKFSVRDRAHEIMWCPLITALPQYKGCGVLRHRASTMNFNVSASASGSDLPRSLPWRMPLRTVVFLGAVITGSAGLTAKNPTMVLLAQQADKRDQNYYANAHPYLEEEPLKKLVKRIPELKGLRPTADQQALPMILEKSGERVDEFFHNVVDLLAHEEIA